ncbi:hypothetical protein [Chitinimonas koreensis]|uniref:hypothetical protein n=1 Tax=Chitinimonas koreensis TaxID=356302 RepID=UPI00041054ED|nr:hypothetical protein [Chitinimonas koreensis]QNM98649.1 hypothetical protein H9L41_10755 [Chitinimonas koreensis]
MNGLRIEHWHNRYRSAAPLPPERLRGWDAALAGLDLDAGFGLGADEWLLIRTLTLRLRWDADRGDAQVAAAWQAALQQAVAAALERGDDTVAVRYRDRRAALADLVYQAACGRTARAWAWRQMGWLADDAVDVPTLREAALRALQADSESIWPVLTRLIAAETATGALTALLQAVPPPAWLALFGACPQTAGYLAWTPPARAAVLAAPALPANPLVIALRRWIEAQPWLAARQRAALAVLLAGAGWPGAAAGGGRQAEARVAAAWLAAEPSSATALPLRTVRGDGERPAAAGERAAAPAQSPHAAPPADQAAAHAPPAVPPRPGAATDLPQPHAAAEGTAEPAEAAAAGAGDLPLPPLPEPAEWQASDWGGLLFLLHAVPALGWLDAADDEALPPRLWRLATEAIGVPADDVAVRAFCGGWQPSAAELAAWRDAPRGSDTAGTASASNGDRADAPSEIAGLLAAWLTHRLGPGTGVAAVCRRPARLRIEPGWIEVHFPLEQADVRLRRAALDLDPGWLPWLGCVVRFVYE